ncbi:hypothetical protein Ancab_015665 [Ancistrocladus abbreviatus]
MSGRNTKVMGIGFTKFSVVLLMVALAAMSTRLVHGDLDPNSPSVQPILAPTPDSENYVHPDPIKFIWPRPWNQYNPQECFQAISSVTSNCYYCITTSLHINSECCKAFDYAKEKCRLHISSSLKLYDPVKFLRVLCVHKNHPPPPTHLRVISWSLSLSPPPLLRIWNPYNPQECLGALWGVRNKCKLGISLSFRLPSVDSACCKALDMKTLIVSIDSDKEIEVSFKYERKSDHNGDKCGNPKAERYSASLKATNISDNNASFLSVEEILKHVSIQGRNDSLAEKVIEEEQGLRVEWVFVSIDGPILKSGGDYAADGCALRGPFSFPVAGSNASSNTMAMESAQLLPLAPTSVLVSIIVFLVDFSPSTLIRVVRV